MNKQIYFGNQQLPGRYLRKAPSGVLIDKVEASRISNLGNTYVFKDAMDAIES
jgi:hypothetical protein